MTLKKKVPAKMKSWIISGFSLDFDHGFGLVKQPSKLTVSNPFYIYLDLPFSIKSGEIISIQAVIFNHMKNDYPATVTMFNEKHEFEFVEATESQKMLVKKITSKADKGTPVTFKIKALKTGFIILKIEATISVASDCIEKLLLVKSEGITRYVTDAFIISLKNQSKFTKTVDLVVPKEIVPDSLRVEVSFIGDLLGPTLDNLENLM